MQSYRLKKTNWGSKSCPNIALNTKTKTAYAYLPQRGVADAIAEVNRINEEGYRYGISLDLKSFFDNVPDDRLTYQLRKHIADKRMVRLVNDFLTPLVIGRGKKRLTRNSIGTPQGSVLSPWLASMLIWTNWTRNSPDVAR